ncbi:MAG: hypothetical protein JXQ99_16985 [Hyphomicrobiaceae bacterium]
MAATTFNASLARKSAEQSELGFFARFAQRFVAQRTAKARQMTALYLESYSDEQLVRCGWSAEEIKRLRNIV